MKGVTYMGQQVVTVSGLGYHHRLTWNFHEGASMNSSGI